MPNEFNQRVIDEFRANQGRVGGYFEGARLLLLTTTGARSGQPHTTPLGYLPDGERLLVIASAGGAPRHPAWFHNLLADPVATVEDGVFRYQVRATVLAGAERDEMFTRAAEADSGWADYQARAGRVLPVVALVVVPGPPDQNATSAGVSLRQVHDGFRRELALIRQEIAVAGPGLGAQLRVNCLTLCQRMHGHHVQEDEGMFPYFAGRHPELKPVFDRLRDEHQRVATLVAELQAVISTAGADPGLVRAEVDRLADELERHLTYEEEQLIPLLDG